MSDVEEAHHEKVEQPQATLDTLTLEKDVLRDSYCYSFDFDLAMYS